MELSINLKQDKPNGNERVKKAQQSKQDSQFQPTWEEVWVTGYVRPTGTTKQGIFQSKNTDLDLQRLKEVKQAVEDGTLGSGVENLKKFTKAHALRLYNDLKEIKRKQVAEDMIANRPKNYLTITTVKGLQELIQKLDQEPLIAVDTETTGLEWTDVTVGISLTLPHADKHYYIPYGHNIRYKQLDRRLVLSSLREPLERPGLKIVFANGKFDVHMLHKDGIDLKENFFFDTLIAMHILNENENSYALKNLANKYGKFFGYEEDSMSFTDLFSKDPQDFINADIELSSIYACKDTHLTYLMYKWQLEQLEKQPKLYSTYFDIEQPITKVAIEMERNGMAMDIEFSKKYGQELFRKLVDLEKEIHDNWGDINTDSPKQLGEKLFVELGYKDISGKGSTKAKVLKQLAKSHDDIQVLLDYRDLSKLYNTYVKPLPTLLRHDIPEYGIKGDGRLHGQFNQTGTVTGRFSSDSPNLQNIPAKARKMFVAPEGRVLIGIDYSQIEPRVLASMSGDELFKRPYEKGDDLYVQIASDVYNIPYEHCLESDDTYWREHTQLPKHPRKLAKVILLAVMYGISPFSLADTIQATPEEAEKFIEDFYVAYPVVKAFMDETVAIVDSRGYVETMFGRKRRFPGHTEVAKRYHAVAKTIRERNGGELPKNIWKSKLSRNLKKAFWEVSKDYSRAERQSVNAVIQGSASEVLKRAMVSVHDFINENELDWKLVATIHDEILIEVPETITEKELLDVENVMKSTTTLAIPVKVDTEIMQRWGEGVPKQEWLNMKEEN